VTRDTKIVAPESQADPRDFDVLIAQARIHFNAFHRNVPRESGRITVSRRGKSFKGRMSLSSVRTRPRYNDARGDQFFQQLTGIEADHI
jgi:hypothetical protein